MPTATGGAQFVATYSGPSGASAANVIALVKIGGNFVQATIDEIAQGWHDFVTEFMSDDWYVQGEETFYDLSSDPHPELIADTATDVGTDTSDALPPQVALVLSLKASSGGRRGRGRIYLPGVPDSSVSAGGAVDSGFVNDTLDGFSDWASLCASLGWLPAVYSRTDGVVRAVTTIYISPFVDTQRRRMERIDAAS